MSTDATPPTPRPDHAHAHEQDAADPMPLPPEPPDINDCCGNGCAPCIFDTHDLAMDAHRQLLRAWQGRQDMKGTQKPSRS